jgi:hypothetical protein
LERYQDKQRLARISKPLLLLNHLRQIIEKIKIKSNSDIQDRALILFSWVSATRHTKPTSKLLCIAANLQPGQFPSRK